MEVFNLFGLYYIYIYCIYPKISITEFKQNKFNGKISLDRIASYKFSDSDIVAAISYQMEQTKLEKMKQDHIAEIEKNAWISTHQVLKHNY